MVPGTIDPWQSDQHQRHGGEDVPEVGLRCPQAVCGGFVLGDLVFQQTVGFVQGGGTLPQISLTVTESTDDNTAVVATGTPTTNLDVDDDPTISVTPGSVSESAASGTTNAALSSYLLRHALVPSDASEIEVEAEQGLELGRPSSIHSRIALGDNGRIERLQVGGVATVVFKGEIYL